MEENDFLFLEDNRGAVRKQGSRERVFRFRRRAKRRTLVTYAADEAAFRREWKAFTREIKTLSADHDIVNGIRREYVSTSRLYPCYEKTFREKALWDSSLSYRLRKIPVEDFSDDFLVLEDARRHEAKYYVNRLNHHLLKKLFLPHLHPDLRRLADEIAALETGLRWMVQIVDPEEEWLDTVAGVKPA